MGHNYFFTTTKYIIYFLLQKFVTSIFKNIYEKLTYDDFSDDDHIKILLRQELNDLMCKLGDPECISKSLSYFTKFKAKNET